MTLYGIVGLRSMGRGRGFRPDLPRGWGFVEIASPGPGGQSLYALRSPASWQGGLPAHVTALSTRHEGLIQSGEQWPPALAYARTVAGGDIAGFAERHVAGLARMLALQPETPFFLARLRTDELIGGAYAGEYVWVVRHDPERHTVGWVTRGDYFVYEDAVEKFDIRVHLLEALVAWSSPAAKR